MSQDRRTSNQQPNSTRPMAVRRTEPEPKKTGCSSAGAVVFLFAVIAVVVLMLTGVIPSPFEAQITIPAEVDSTPDNVKTPINFETETVTQEQVILIPSNTPAPTHTVPPTPTSTPWSAAFVIRGTPEAFPHTLLYDRYTCEEYLFIGGEVWDLRESPLKGLTVKLTGTYGGDAVDISSESGELEIYGQSGYGFVLDNLQVKTDSLYIQLFDALGNPLSAKVKLNISGECDGNLLLVNYKQVQEISN